MFLISILLSLGCFGVNVKGETTRTVPELLRPCYKTDYNEAAYPPLSMTLLIELIRKIELDPRHSLNMRLISSAIFQGVLLDGIRKQQGYNDKFINYAASGSEFFKYKLIADNLVAETNYPNDTLTTDELCFLHRLISNTIDPSDIDDCAIIRPMPLEMDETDLSPSFCQVKRGTVLTNWGSVTASHLLTAIAYGMEQSEVTFERLQKSKTHEKIFAAKVNEPVTLYVTTIAADLAELVLQLDLNPTIGSEGIWNDTDLPRAYYLKTNATSLTEDEILAGIDATIIGYKIKDWTNKRSSLRLSQVLDMYYSNRGISFDRSLKAGTRSTIFQSVKEDVNLENQVIGTYHSLLAVGAELKGSPSEEDIENLSKMAVKTFSSKSDSILKKYSNVESINLDNKNAPQELLIVLDNSYDTYTSQRILNNLAESLQTSYYGTKIGIINGETGNWISNMTTEIYDLFKGLHQAQNAWPAILNVETAFKTIISHYQNKTNGNCSRATKPTGKSIVIFSKSGRVTDLEKTAADNSVSQIKNAFPETNIIYVTNDESGFFDVLSKKYKNDTLVKMSSEITQVVNKIMDKLRDVPASIVNYYCDNNKLRFEDYITPGIESVYEIHEEYIRRTHFYTKIKNYNYGNINICATGTANEGRRICRSMEKNGDYRFNTTSFCLEDAPCNVKIYVSTNSTANNCAETDCRYPDQVRIEITYSYSGATWSYPLVLLTLITYIVNLSTQ